MARLELHLRRLLKGLIRTVILVLLAIVGILLANYTQFWEYFIIVLAGAFTLFCIYMAGIV